MRALVIILALACGAAAAQPVRTCVPTALLDRLAAYVARQPWADVAPIMDGLREVARAPVPCEPPSEAKP